jgi:alpha-D-ribose 1-methylphosphonate 5-triphosphate synthase subunit PhnG
MTATNHEKRQAWMSTLAKAEPTHLAKLFDTLGSDVGYSDLRKAETGLVMVRGKSGGVGNQFNLGEMTVTRGAVRLESGETGLSYVAGRDKKHAELAAVVDGLMQNSEWRERADDAVIKPLQSAYEEKQQQVLRQRAATRVDFFTMTRTREDKK